MAASHHYLSHLNTLRLIASAVLAVVLPQLVLLGVNLHLHWRRPSAGQLFAARDG